jgi:hypothetical protein
MLSTVSGLNALSTILADKAFIHSRLTSRIRNGAAVRQFHANNGAQGDNLSGKHKVVSSWVVGLCTYLHHLLSDTGDRVIAWEVFTIRYNR